MQSLDPERATESPDAIVRGRTVVIHEDMVVATIGKMVKNDAQLAQRGAARRVGQTMTIPHSELTLR